MIAQISGLARGDRPGKGADPASIEVCSGAPPLKVSGLKGTEYHCQDVRAGLQGGGMFESASVSFIFRCVIPQTCAVVPLVWYGHVRAHL